MNNERRQANRFQAEVSVWVRTPESVFSRARVRDVSYGGAALEVAKDSYKPEVDLVVRLDNGRYLSLKGYARWYREGCLGVQFRKPAKSLIRYLGTRVGAYFARFATKKRCTLDRALLSLDRTVPSGTPRMSATS